MMGVNGEKQHQFMFFNIEDYVPQGHLLRWIHEQVDFTFIYEKVQHLYSPLGRRSIDPVLLIKMILVGYLYGIPSERKLEEEVKLNLAYRWFLGLDLNDSVPDHSTLSQNRRRRFRDSFIFQEIFDHVVRLCIDKGIVTGEVIVTDSTHIKANAAMSKKEKVSVSKTPLEYMKTLEEEVKRLEDQREEQRKTEGKKKCGKPKQERSAESSDKEVQQSLSDSDSGMLSRPNKPKGFHYLAHTSIDTRKGIITDIHVTAGNFNDHEPYIGRMAAQQEKFGLNIQKAGADKGYDCAVVHHSLEQLGITPYISPVAEEFNIEDIEGKPFVYNAD